MRALEWKSAERSRGGVMAMVDGGYTVIGKPAGVDYNNNWWYDVGVGQDLANGVVNLSVFFEEYRAIVPGLANARDILTAVSVTRRERLAGPGVGAVRSVRRCSRSRGHVRREQAVLRRLMAASRFGRRARSFERRSAGTARRLACWSPATPVHSQPDDADAGADGRRGRCRAGDVRRGVQGAVGFQVRRRSSRRGSIGLP